MAGYKHVEIDDITSTSITLRTVLGLLGQIPLEEGEKYCVLCAHNIALPGKDFCQNCGDLMEKRYSEEQKDAIDE